MRRSLKVGIVAAVVAMSLAAAERASAQVVPYIWEVKANEEDRTLTIAGNSFDGATAFILFTDRGTRTLPHLSMDTLPSGLRQVVVTYPRFVEAGTYDLQSLRGGYYDLIGVKIGQAGPTGPAGPEGPAGPPGPEGAVGPEGPRGRRGEPGPIGPVGPAGPRGPRGFQGPEGPMGVPGLPGEQGPPGPAGPVGMNWRGAWNASLVYALGDGVFHNGSAWIARGSHPPFGEPGQEVIWNLLAQQGEPGAPGADGADGAPGPLGAPGPMGPAGPTGPQGIQGPFGLRWRGPWLDGVTYSYRDAVFHEGSAWVADTSMPPSGEPGVDSNWRLLAQRGDPGPAGETTGVPGPTGPPGEMGPAGPAGSPGEPGPPGAQGEPGAAGPTGPVGPQGEIGPSGPAGPAGATGDAGAAGAAGPTGPAGPPGPPGAQGPEGPAGPQGVAGLTWRGAYDGEMSTEYAAGDVVYYNGSAWVAESPTMAEPGVDDAWGLLAQGDSGAGGVQDVTASAPLTSSGGLTPNISLTGVVPVNRGGTGLGAAGASGTYLRSNGATLSFSQIQAADVQGSIASATNFTGSLAGDVTGTQGDTTVERIRGRLVANQVPGVNTAMVWSGASWAPGFVLMGGDATGGHNNMTVTRLRNVNVPVGVPDAGQMLVGSGGAWSFGVTLSNASTSIGASAMADTGASASVAVGASALRNNSAAGHWNTAVGHTAMVGNVNGTGNVAVGAGALDQGASLAANTAVGHNALGGLNVGSSNISIGSQSGVNVSNGSDNIFVGSAGLPGDNGVIRIGKPAQTQTFIAGIHGVAAPAGLGVVIAADGKLGTVVSSRRFKDDIRPMSDTTDRFMKLKPVTFRYKDAAADGSHPVQYGLIAEEVAAAYPDLVAYGDDGKPLTVYYQFLAPILLNRVQEQQRTIDDLTSRLLALEQRMSAGGR